VRVSHRHLHRRVPEQFLDHLHRLAAHREVRGEGVALMPCSALAPLCRPPGNAASRSQRACGRGECGDARGIIRGLEGPCWWAKIERHSSGPLPAAPARTSLSGAGLPLMRVLVSHSPRFNSALRRRLSTQNPSPRCQPARLLTGLNLFPSSTGRTRSRLRGARHRSRRHCTPRRWGESRAGLTGYSPPPSPAWVLT
jgi:hypothetical protein